MMIGVDHRQPDILHAGEAEAFFDRDRIQTADRLVKRNAAEDLDRLHRLGLLAGPVFHHAVDEHIARGGRRVPGLENDRGHAGLGVVLADLVFRQKPVKRVGAAVRMDIDRALHQLVHISGRKLDAGHESRVRNIDLLRPLAEHKVLDGLRRAFRQIQVRQFFEVFHAFLADFNVQNLSQAEIFIHNLVTSNFFCFKNG